MAAEQIEGYMDDDEARRYLALRMAIDVERDAHLADVVVTARHLEAYLKGETDAKGETDRPEESEF